jgi:hypothetical protein
LIEPVHAPLSRSPARHEVHASHRVARSPVWYVPDAQPSQANRPAEETNFPAVQAPHVPSFVPSHPLAQTSPVRHVRQFTQAGDPLPVWKVPTAHGAHTVAPWALWNLPWVHLMHTLAWFPVWNVPARHGLHWLDLTSSWNSPSTQGTHDPPAVNNE